MNILFLTMSRLYTLEQEGIYPDLLNEFVNNGHNVCVAAPAERRMGEATNLKRYDGYSVLRIKVGNLQKTNIIEKGISTVLLERQFLRAIRKYYSDIKFDVVMYSTPPITFSGVIDYIKKRDDAKSYLLLKDIFPQNAVDLGMFAKGSIFYKYFRNKEKQLYRQSDYIGCMSQANVEFVLKNNPEIDPKRVHISPNSIKAIDIEKNAQKRTEVRRKYNIPESATVFVYGGNLGRPQGIPFLVECLRANAQKNDRFFVVCGTGTEYSKLKVYADSEKQENFLLINGLPKTEYEELVTACDVGLIFLDKRFTIPNFPSRLLSYMQNGMPVISCTDKNTDIGKVIEEGGFGWHTISDNTDEFTRAVDKACTAPLDEMGEKALSVLKRDYTSERCYNIIMENLK